MSSNKLIKSKNILLKIGKYDNGHLFKNISDIVFFILKNIVFKGILPLNLIDLENKLIISKNEKNIYKYNIKFNKKSFKLVGDINNKPNNFFHYLNINLNDNYKVKRLKQLLETYNFGLIHIKIDNSKMSNIIELLNEKFKLTLIVKSNLFFLPKNGKAPYFSGQTIYDKYIIKDLIKDGIKNNKSNVFLISNMKKELFIMKIYAKKHHYNKEKDALFQTYDWKYSPLIIEYNDYKQLLIIEWCGQDLKDKDKKFQLNYIKKIRMISDKLTKIYNIYHNDIRWKNICLDKGNIKLIDWENSGIKDIERNDDKILLKNE